MSDDAARVAAIRERPESASREDVEWLAEQLTTAWAEIEHLRHPSQGETVTMASRLEAVQEVAEQYKHRLAAAEAKLAEAKNSHAYERHRLNSVTSELRTELAAAEAGHEKLQAKLAAAEACIAIARESLKMHACTAADRVELALTALAVSGKETT